MYSETKDGKPKCQFKNCKEPAVYNLQTGSVVWIREKDRWEQDDFSADDNVNDFWCEKHAEGNI